jgi:hypothetical protein
LVCQAGDGFTPPAEDEDFSAAHAMLSTFQSVAEGDLAEGALASAFAIGGVEDFFPPPPLRGDGSDSEDDFVEPMGGGPSEVRGESTRF